MTSAEGNFNVITRDVPEELVPYLGSTIKWLEVDHGGWGNYRKDDHRKIDVRIDKFDTWSLDHTLANIILPALLQLKATKHGIPHEFVADVGGADYDSQDHQHPLQTHSVCRV